jgi:hypothetical protein
MHLIISMVCHEQNADAVSSACLLNETVPKVLQPTLSACFTSKRQPLLPFTEPQINNCLLLMLDDLNTKVLESRALDDTLEEL